ncbi:MAG: 2-hydroxyacid dehydrogenase [Acidobacteriota bacterium]|jgi:phosphoglycerate dehydrogenase-like enzyme|nr:dehydrogenase [Bryobacteraceae bacterium CoA2 C42]MCA2962447.1 dehydrogenase [Acidobacteriaceae bacterium]
MQPFRVGVTPDFYIDAKGRFEQVVEAKFAVPNLEWEAMPEMPGNHATPEVLNRYDAVFALSTKIDAASLRGVDRLAIVARWGVGYDRIDTEALTAADVVLAITPNAVRTPVAEAILTLVLALAKNLLIQDRLTRQGKWRGDLPRLGRNLRGQVLGSIGCGNIGRELFRLAQPFGFSRLLAHDPYVEAVEGVEMVDLDAVCRESDFVCVNTLLNESTRGLVNERLFRLMKPTAHFINTARGPIVDETALIRALAEGWIAGAGIDVFEQEPPRPDHPLLAMDNVIVTPHGLPWTEEIARDNGLEACDNILAVARGQAPGGVVNRAVLSRPGFQNKLHRYL